MKKNIYIPILCTLILLGCSKNFLDRPALDSPTLDNFYNTIEEVQGATGVLYGFPWFDFNDKALHCIGEVLSGNMYTGDPQYAPYQNFTITATDARLSEAWNAFFKIVGWSNVLIKAFEDKKAVGGDASILDQGIAEARFIRGVGYFYIGRIWGDAPIITDPSEMSQTGDFEVPKAPQADVLRFALEDFQYAEANLPPTNSVKGRVTSYSAKGMMAKLYLYLKQYDNARTKAKEVIDSELYGLFNDYFGMFSKSANNNNIETLFALQWVISNEWGSQNSMQAYIAPSNLLVTGDGWSSVMPSLDILDAYEPGDMRRRWSLMEHGAVYSDWRPTREGNAAYNAFMANGYRYDTLEAAPLGHRTPVRSSVTKYVVGPGSDTEPVLAQRTQIGTYILRYADVLLIYAEAVLGDNASTSDITALDAYNAVRQRANLTPRTSITLEQILHERRMEFAFEGDYWFDIQRQGLARAQQIIAAQERGSYNEDGSLNSLQVNLSLPGGGLFLPIPLSETVQNPKLLEAPVPYY